MKDELDIAWIEMIMACVRVLYRHSPAGTEEDCDEPVGILGDPFEIRARHLGNASQKRYHVSQLACPRHVMYPFVKACALVRLLLLVLLLAVCANH
jgi:hypothetical protein